MENIIDYNHFNKVDIRVGTILEADINLSLKTPSIVMLIDFLNKIGIKKSSAQLTANYNPDKIINMQVAAVVNFKPKQIGKLISEVLVLGFPDKDNQPILISPNKIVQNGVKLY